MELYILLLSTCSVVLAHFIGYPENQRRSKRDVVNPDELQSLDFYKNYNKSSDMDLLNTFVSSGIKMPFFFKLDQLERSKRDVGGQLEIVSNHAQPILADVKPEKKNGVVNITTTTKPCPMNASIPSHIESGTGFKVLPTAAKDNIFHLGSGRKSWPPTHRLDMIRSLTRVVTLAVLLFSAAIEFYPLIHHLYHLYHL